VHGRLPDRTSSNAAGLAAEGLRERKKRLMRQQLSDTATAMFLERGFDEVRVAEIAAACGVSEKTVFNYFPVKEALLMDRLEANLAALWRLPIVFFCENNGYGELSAARLVVSVPDISVRAAGYGIPGVTVDGQDVVAVYEVVSEAVARARRGEGPSLVETKTYRFHDHAFGLPERAYRDAAEVDEWRKRDPVELFRARLLAEGMLDEAAVNALEDAVSAEIEAAISFAESSPYPSADAAFDHVYTNPIPIRR